MDAGVTLQCGWYAREAAVLEGDWHGARASCSQHSALASVAVLGCQAQHEAQVQLSAVTNGRECADSLHVPCVLFSIAASEVHTTCLQKPRDCFTNCKLGYASTHGVAPAAVSDFATSLFPILVSQSMACFCTCRIIPRHRYLQMVRAEPMHPFPMNHLKVSDSKFASNVAYTSLQKYERFKADIVTGSRS